jgi:hypothetical protein
VLVFSAVYYRYIRNCRSHVTWAWTKGELTTRTSVGAWDASVFGTGGLPATVDEEQVRYVLEALFPGQVVSVLVVKDRTEEQALEQRYVCRH